MQSPKGNKSLWETKDLGLSKQSCKQQKSRLYTSIHSSLRFIASWKIPTETSGVTFSVKLSLQIVSNNSFPTLLIITIFKAPYSSRFSGIILLKIVTGFKLAVWSIIISEYCYLYYINVCSDFNQYPPIGNSFASLAEHVILILLSVLASIYHNIKFHKCHVGNYTCTWSNNLVAK